MPGQEITGTRRTSVDVSPPRPKPASTTRRPPEPLRPLPARYAGATLLSVKIRRRRLRPGALPPGSGESEHW